MERIEDLTESVKGLRSEVGALRAAFRARTRTVVVVALVLVVVVVMVTRVQASNERRLQENNRRWCPLVALLIPQSGDAAPTTQRGREIAQRAQSLARDFRCPTT